MTLEELAIVKRLLAGLDLPELRNPDDQARPIDRERMADMLEQIADVLRGFASLRRKDLL